VVQVLLPLPRLTVCLLREYQSHPCERFKATPSAQTFSHAPQSREIKNIAILLILPATRLSSSIINLAISTAL
jgi:hypothetical protein